MVRQVAETALAAGLAPVSVVIGHEAERVEAALAGLDVRILHNPDFGQGLSTSLAAGLAEVEGFAEGVVVALGDMPGVGAATYRALLTAFAANRDAPAVVPLSSGERGNPVLLGRALFAGAQSLSGDQGARKLVAAAGDRVVEVPVDDPFVLVDLDTPEALEAWRRRTTP
jgi:molybdenum cofactor cytidylyltransferase